MTTNSACARSQANYASPVYLNNVQHVAGTIMPVVIQTGAATTFQAKLPDQATEPTGIQAVQKTLS